MHMRYSAGLKLAGIFLSLFLPALIIGTVSAQAPPAENPQSGSLGVGGEVGSAPPSQGATITVPVNGQRFNNLPITVAGICPNGLLVEIYKNNVFAGAVDCADGSFSLAIDLFDGRNDLVARVYDALRQKGPDSNTVTVHYSSALPSSGPRITITTEYSKRGANPGNTLNWPISISGGSPPYAVSIDWGDQTEADLISRVGPGDFVLEHIYQQAGVYTIIIKATDSNGDAAFLQVVGIGNGPIQQRLDEARESGEKPETVILWWPFLLIFVFTAIAFWLGQKHQLETIRERLRRGERPFK